MAENLPPDLHDFRKITVNDFLYIYMTTYLYRMGVSSGNV